MRTPLVGGTAREILKSAAARLADAGITSPRVDAEWLLAGVLGVGRAAVSPLLDEPLPSTLVDRFERGVRRRVQREPLQRILGWEEFRGLRFTLTSAVLVPRPETEMLVEWALELLPPLRAGRPLRAIDVGTGSGCIACALAQERPDLEVIATDASWTAVAVARDNARRLGLADRVRVVTVNLLSAVGPATADLIVSNPPYLPTEILAGLAPEVRDHEPRAALDGGDDGLRTLRRLVVEARRALKASGALVLETAGGGQAVGVAALARAAGFAEVAIRRDLADVERFVVGGPAARALSERA